MSSLTLVPSPHFHPSVRILTRSHVVPIAIWSVMMQVNLIARTASKMHLSLAKSYKRLRTPSICHCIFPHHAQVQFVFPNRSVLILKSR